MLNAVNATAHDFGDYGHKEEHAASPSSSAPLFKQVFDNTASPSGHKLADRKRGRGERSSSSLIADRLAELKSKFLRGQPGGRNTSAHAIFQYDDVRFMLELGDDLGEVIGHLANLQHQGLIVFHGLKLVDSGAEVNIEVDLTKFVGYIESSTVTIAMADGKSRLDNRGYGLCRDWYSDQHGGVYVDEYYAYYCPNAAYSIRSQHNLAAEAGGSIMLDPKHDQIVKTDNADVHISGDGMYLCAKTGQAVKCIQVQQKNLSWLRSLPPKEVPRNEDNTVKGTTVTDVDSVHIISHLSGRFPDMDELAQLSAQAMAKYNTAVSAGQGRTEIDPSILANVQKVFRQHADGAVERLSKVHNLDDEIDMSMPVAEHQKTYQNVRAQIEALTRQVAMTVGNDSEVLEDSLRELSSAAG